MLMVIQFVSKEVNCFLLLLKSCKNGVIDFLRQGDDISVRINNLLVFFYLKTAIAMVLYIFIHLLF